jgi:hypothetical protein
LCALVPGSLPFVACSDGTSRTHETPPVGSDAAADPDSATVGTDTDAATIGSPADAATIEAGSDGGSPPPVKKPPSTPSEGWTELTKSADTRVVHVSSSSGDDSRDGSTPELAIASLTKGYSLLRDGYPDWLVLKAGDTWSGSFGGKWEKSGRSATEKMVVSSYDSGPAPQIRTPLGGNAAVWIVDATSHLAIVGLDLRPQFRAPGEADFDATATGKNAVGGISIYNGPTDILIEGCHLAYYTTNILIQAAPKPVTDVQIRRNVIVDAYSDVDVSHSQGIYSTGTVRLLIEDNIFDHNGWNEKIPGAVPTIFNHSMYIDAPSEDSVIRGNLSMRASSMCAKIKSEATYANTGLLVENNTCIEDAIGVSLGGKTAPGGLMYRNATVRRNVVSHQISSPGLKTTCLAIDLSSCEGASVTGNYLLDTTCNGISGFAVVIQDLPNKDIMVTDNVFRAWVGTEIANNAPDQSSITVANNWIDRPAGEFIDGSRSIESYAAAKGVAGGVAGLIKQARQQSKAGWRPELSGAAIVDYIAEGFKRP